MYLDKIHSLQTGVSLEISTIALRALIRDVMVGQRITELAKICGPMDLYDYLSVVVYKGAEGLICRRHAWVDEIKNDLLAGRPVSFRGFDKLSCLNYSLYSVSYVRLIEGCYIKLTFYLI